MSCCEGANFSSPLPVPSDGQDGPVFYVGFLAARKTFTLSGALTGRYDILASPDGTLFVPIASFIGDGGPQPAKIDSEVTAQFVRVRRKSGGPDATIFVAGQFTCGCPLGGGIA